MPAINSDSTGLKAEPWYRGPKDSSHDHVMATILYIRKHQKLASDQHWSALRMYSGFAARLAYGVDKRQIMPHGEDRARLKLNVVRRCVDATHARIAQNKPKPTFLTSGGDFSAQRKAKKTDKLCNGMFYSAKAYKHGSEVARDAGIFGTGAMKCFPDSEGRPKLERRFIDCIVVDEIDGINRSPRNLFEYQAVDRDMLLAKPEFKKYADKIAIAGMPDETTFIANRNTLADQVALAEAWHLPSFPGAKDGRHILCVDNCTLIDEPWEYDYHPFVFLRWCTRPLGFWGQGIAEQLAGVQYEINELLEVIQEQMLLAGPKVFIERGANIVEQHLTNDIWSVIEYTGAPPTFTTFSSVAPEFFEHLDRLYQRSFDEIGISQLSAHGEKPPGLNSGKAQLVFSDIETSNFSVFGFAYEDMFIELSERCLDIARETHLKPDKDGKKKPFVVMTPTKSRGQRVLEKINWSDIGLTANDYQIQVFPTSLLPTQPAGRLQAVGDMMDRGMLKGDQAVSLLDFPDLEAVNSLITAPLDDVDWLTEQMLDEGEPMTPEPFSNLELAVQRMASHYIRAKLNGYPEERLDLLRRYINTADAMNKAKQAAATAAGPGGAMAQPALPNGMQAPPAPVQGAPGMAA